MKSIPVILLLMLLFTMDAWAQSDTRIIPDDYPVTYKMLAADTNYLHQKKSGPVFSLDMAWFTNDTLKQTLVFHLATDYHRLYVYHFYNDDVPSGLIKKIWLLVAKTKTEFDTATYVQKQTYFNGFISSATRINPTYFTSEKGFKLGDKKEKAISIYGKPDKYLRTKDLEQYDWTYKGDYGVAERPAAGISDKPIAKNSFGYSVTMFFKNRKLIAILLFNDIP